MCNNNNDCKCIAEILTVICILQQNAVCGDACLETCDRGFLGNTATSFVFNTRPIMLYTCCGNGTPWRMPQSDKIIYYVIKQREKLIYSNYEKQYNFR